MPGKFIVLREQTFVKVLYSVNTGPTYYETKITVVIVYANVTNKWKKMNYYLKQLTLDQGRIRKQKDFILFDFIHSISLIVLFM